jgi:multiple sugar transport system ATP-binding protein
VNKFVAGFIGSPAMNFITGEIIRDEGLCFKAAQMKLRIPDARAAGLAEQIGQLVILGIRPEDISEYESNASQIPETSATCRVEVVEPMGNEIFVYLANGPDALVARMNVQSQPIVHADYRVQFDMQKAHFFRTENETAIY